MASHQLIDAYLAALAERLPCGIVDELADGLLESWHTRVQAGTPPDAAAHAALNDFGSLDEITHAFIDQSPTRKLARGLLLTGPIVGACWAAAFVAAQAWTWPIPPAGAALFAIALLTVIAILLLGARSSDNYRITRVSGTVGGFGAIEVQATGDPQRPLVLETEPLRRSPKWVNCLTSSVRRDSS